MTDSDIRAALSQHWAASDANDFELEHQIYREDAVLTSDVSRIEMTDLQAAMGER
jgi:hypothetical protein